MSYLISALTAIVAATMILFSKFEVDDSSVIEELALAKVMFVSIDKYINTYLVAGGSLTTVNFKELENKDILSPSVVVQGSGNASLLSFQESDITWQLIPNKNDVSSYQLLVDVSQSTAFQGRMPFFENYFGKKLCGELLFGTFEANLNFYHTTDLEYIDRSNNRNVTNKDGLFVCTVYK